MSAENYRVYQARILNPAQQQGIMHYIEDAALVVNSSGRIEFCGSRGQAEQDFPESPVSSYPSSLIMPGLVDTHVHLPQFQAIGLGKGELLDWLKNYIFPLEKKFADADFARRHSEIFFRELLAHGTTSAAVYCSSHREATDIAFAAAAQSGIRVCMGKSIMERNAPPELISSAAQNIRDSVELAQKWHNFDDGRLRYVLTPRFAGSCSYELMQECADIAASEGLAIQTHLAENPAELELMKKLFPERSSYTEIYEHAGLLSPATLLAHCIHLSPGEREIIKRHNCSVAHCPGSNRFLQSGIMALRKTLSEGVRTGLGSDLAAGYNISILHEAREAIESSKTWNIVHRDEAYEALSVSEALWLATLGGARALNLDSVSGSLDPGKDADFILLDLDTLSPGLELYNSSEDIMARILYASGSVRQTFVRGRRVY